MKDRRIDNVNFGQKVISVMVHGNFQGRTMVSGVSDIGTSELENSRLDAFGDLANKDFPQLRCTNIIYPGCRSRVVYVTI